MNSLDYAVFLVAGILGAAPVAIGHRNEIAWGLVGLWALLKLLHVV